ncbi:MAG: hypothetical protein E3J35_09570 [Methanomassiliicoccales archaeon]|nr:MAG: hypothetical protein E3J35_09570 [Methanomassiliicoccales archaeon]
MKKIEEIKEMISSRKQFLRDEFRVKNVGIFGSYSRKDPDDDSDVDILVEFTRPVGLIEFLRLEGYLQDLLGIKVDLVPKDGIKPALRDYIVNEVIYV